VTQVDSGVLYPTPPAVLCRRFGGCTTRLIAQQHLQRQPRRVHSQPSRCGKEVPVRQPLASTPLIIRAQSHLCLTVLKPLKTGLGTMQLKRCVLQTVLLDSQGVWAVYTQSPALVPFLQGNSWAWQWLVAVSATCRASCEGHGCLLTASDGGKQVGRLGGVSLKLCRHSFISTGAAPQDAAL
jgi:hypothetical protein